MLVAINIEYLKQAYFEYDLPVPYEIDNKIININPISVLNTRYFLSSIDLIMVDKNNIPDAKIIQMSYLDFVLTVLLENNENNKQKLNNILYLCLDIVNPYIIEKEGCLCLYDQQRDIVINSKSFEEIKKIILYQNILNYDDSYINPEIELMMAERDSLENKEYVPISLERKIAIISSHCGITKKEQLNMTYRSHTLLFNEVCEEVEFMTTRLAFLSNNSADKIEHWIYKKNKNKYQKYFVSEQQYSKSMGGDGTINQSTENTNEYYSSQFNSFNI